jgi:hypothetical protein
MFAGWRAKAERVNAMLGAEAIAVSPERVGVAKARAAQDYYESVKVLRKAGATGRPRNERPGKLI